MIKGCLALFRILRAHVIGCQVMTLCQYFVVKSRTSKRRHRRRQTCRGGEPTRLGAFASSLPSPHGWPNVSRYIHAVEQYVMCELSLLNQLTKL